MKVKITPSTCSGSVVIPPSKSMSHRSIIAAALAEGTSIIRNVAFSDDIKITIEAMRQFGATITINEDELTITGTTSLKSDIPLEVYCKESGSSLRFFIPIFSLKDNDITFTGSKRLLERPQTIYKKIYDEQGLPFVQSSEAIQTRGMLSPGKYELDGNVSSQFITGLLYTLPLLDGDSTITIKEPYESRSYVDLTLEMLERFGVHVSYKDTNTLIVKGNQTFKASEYTIEADYSQCGFFAVLAAINNDLTIKGLSSTSKQGDREIIQILKDYNVDLFEDKDGLHVKKSDLKPATINLENCPDLGPILNVLMMYTPGDTNIINAERLRIKESDRIEAMETELAKCGVSMKSDGGNIHITCSAPYNTTQELFGHNDHRIVMALAVAATLFETPTIIDDAQAINKSYPTFFDDLKRVGVQVDEVN